jgi:hypothetical protein
VTVNGKPVAFPTEASYTGEEGDVVSVQSVNEYGALSEMSAEVTLDKATAIEAVTVDDAAKAGAKGTYTLDGKKVQKASQRGVYVEDGAKIAY